MRMIRLLMSASLMFAALSTAACSSMGRTASEADVLAQAGITPNTNSNMMTPEGARAAAEVAGQNASARAN